MKDPLARVALFALYQLTILVGIVLLPVSVVARRLGVTLPANRVLERIDETYQAVRP